MIDEINNNLVTSQWVRLGVLLNAPSAENTPDLERLLIDTARVCESNPRLFVLVVTWLTRYGLYVARHRLKSLAARELTLEHRAVLGLIIDSAIEAGATIKLRTILEACEPAQDPKPLFTIDRKDAWTAKLVKETATKTSMRWNLWVQPFELKHEAIRPVSYVLEQNEGFRERAIRRGDLCCSILEVLRRDASYRRATSGSELARLCSASRKAIREAIDRLEQIEGIRLRQPRSDGKSGVSIKLPQRAA